MAKGKSKTSLGGPQASGGWIALKGFEFQRGYALILLAESLSDPDFRAVVIEGAEDVEIRFDHEGAIERRAVQVKGYPVTLGMAKEIVPHLKELDEASPGTWTSFVIACRALDAKLEPIHNLKQRYRDATDHYDRKKDGVLAETRAELEDKITKAGLPAEFMLKRVSFEPDLPNLAQFEAWVGPRVVRALQRAYPDLTPAASEDAYRRLGLLAAESTAKSLTREQTEKEIAEAKAAQPAEGGGPKVTVEQKFKTVERGTKQTGAKMKKAKRGDVTVRQDVGTAKGDVVGVELDELG